MAVSFFKRKPPAAPKPQERGVYIWAEPHGYSIVRFLLVGNDSLLDLSREQWRELHDQLLKLIDSKDGDDVRIYSNYIALSLYGIRLTDELTKQLLEVLTRALQWPDMPELGRISTMAEYNALNQKYEKVTREKDGFTYYWRWRLGSYQR